LVSAVGIVPLPETGRLLRCPAAIAASRGARPLVFVLIVIPVTQYAVMPLLTRAARPFLYPVLAREPRGGGS